MPVGVVSVGSQVNRYFVAGINHLMHLAGIGKTTTAMHAAHYKRTPKDSSNATGGREMMVITGCRSSCSITP